jgi:hypothetical protein
MGLGDPVVAEPLERHGFNAEVMEEGWRHLRALTHPHRGKSSSAGTLIEQIDRAENLWFPVARIALRDRYPEIHEALFDGLRQTSGREVIISADIFLSRLDAMAAGEEPFGSQGPEAHSLLEARGLTEAVTRDLRALVEMAQGIREIPPALATAEAQKLASQRLAVWYREWSGIARAVITNRQHLRMLGLHRRRPASSDAASPAVDTAEATEITETQESPIANVTPALPAETTPLVATVEAPAPAVTAPPPQASAPAVTTAPPQASAPQAPVPVAPAPVAPAPVAPAPAVTSSESAPDENVPSYVPWFGTENVTGAAE